MKLIQAHTKVLSQIINLLNNLSVAQLTYKSNLLYNASIGEHIRHIIEFYRCCLSQSKNGIINYDSRPREKQLEKDPNATIKAINELLSELNNAKNDKKSLHLQSQCIDSLEGVPTNLERELVFCLDHCIHHQSIIKIGLKEMGLDKLIDKDFGVAFSTLSYRKQCAS